MTDTLDWRAALETEALKLTIGCMALELERTVDGFSARNVREKACGAAENIAKAVDPAMRDVTRETMTKFINDALHSSTHDEPAWP